MRKFIDINSHYFSCDEKSLANFRTLLAGDALHRIVISSTNLRLEHSADYPFMSRFATSNEKLFEFVRQLDSPKLIPWCYIDPSDADAAAQLERWARQGMRGVKMYPPRGFFVDDPRALRVFKAAEALNLPVFLHMGRTAPHPQLDSQYAQPLKLERVGLACPKVKVLIGHFAAPWSREAMHISMGFPNFYFDLSTNGSLDLAFSRLVCDAIESLGVRRLIFGSNGDGGNNLQKAEKLEARLRAAGFSEAEINAIFFDNAVKELGIAG
jgi:predicted TIM-barrel fold metal-dependent hydrolase